MLNECFADYRNKHFGQACIVFGTGPTVDLYPNDDSLIKLGSNEIIYKPYKMDYYFIGDRGDKKRGYDSDSESYKAYKPKIQKFYRIKEGRHNAFLRGELDGEGYRIKKWNNTPEIHIVDVMPVYTTITLDIVQFCAWAGFKKIFLVGQDCDYSNGSFFSPDFRFQTKSMKQVFTIIKRWLYELGIDCYVINPVGLTMFPEADYKDIRS